MLRNRRRFNVLRWGRRGGKSFLANILMLEAAISSPGTEVLFLAPSSTELKGRYRDAVKMFRPLGCDCKWGAIEFPNGSLITMAGAWRADNLRGNKYHLAICDEWAFAPDAENTWNNVVSPMLADYEGDAFFLSTPKGRNHFWELDQLSQTEPDWASFHFSTEECGQISKKELDRQKRLLPSLVYAQEYLAEYVDRSSAKVKRESVRVGWIDCPAYYMGVDLAISERETADYTAIAVIGRHPDGRILIADVIRGRWSMLEIQEQIEAMASKWNPRIIAVESNQAQAWMVQELLRKTRLPVRGIKSKKDKMFRFQPVEARYEQGLVYHSPALLPEYLDELLSFTGTAQDKHDDMIDAVSLAFETIGKTPGIMV